MAYVNNAALASLILSAAVIAGPAEAGHRNPVDRQSNAAAEEFSDEHIAPPKLARPFVRDGAVTNPEIFHAVKVGQTKDEVRAILGAPLEMASREWDYQVKFSMPASTNYLVCQYLIRFDGEALVKAATWRRRQCADLAQRAIVPQG